MYRLQSSPDHFQAPNRFGRCSKTTNVLPDLENQVHQMFGNYSRRSATRRTVNLPALSDVPNVITWHVITDILPERHTCAATDALANYSQTQ